MLISDADLDFLPIPDPGVKKASDPGSATMIFNLLLLYRSFLINSFSKIPQLYLYQEEIRKWLGNRLIPKICDERFSCQYSVVRANTITSTHSHLFTR